MTEPQLPAAYEGCWIYPHEATWGETICCPSTIDEMQMRLEDGDPEQAPAIETVRAEFAKVRVAIDNLAPAEAFEDSQGIVGYWVVPGVFWTALGGIMSAEGLYGDSGQYLQWECVQRCAAAFSVFHVGLDPVSPR